MKRNLQAERWLCETITSAMQTCRSKIPKMAILYDFEAENTLMMRWKFAVNCSHNVRPSPHVNLKPTLFCFLTTHDSSDKN